MEERGLLIEGAAILGLSLSEEQVNQLLRYKELLLEWNQKLNLTAITDHKEIITKHFLDCLTVNQAIKLENVNSLVDIGTGAGFPGLVIKIAYPHIDITLVDSLNKRLNFLNEVIKELKLEKVRCIHSRAEDLGKREEYREVFDMCASRAVANLAVLSEYTLPFVKQGGYLIALKGQKLDEEIQQGEKAIHILGGKLEEIVDAQVPFTDLNHRIAKIIKVKKTGRQYPRKAGDPAKSPLGT